MVEYQEILGLFLPSFLVSAEIQKADSAQQAIKMLSDAPDFDLIICDYTMNGGSGLDVFMFLQNRNLRIPFILFTADSSVSSKAFKGEGWLGIIAKHDLNGLEVLIRKSLKFSGALATGAPGPSSRLI